MRFILTVILVFLFTLLKAQKADEYARIDNIVASIPDSLSRSTTGIARFINSNFTNEPDKFRAIFFWIAKNISYDYENMFAINFYENTSQVVDEVISTRKGVCMHFAELFDDLARKSGLKSYVISGYTKQNGKTDYIPHAWCAGLIDTTWFLFDPTWGSGYVQNKKFVKQLNNDYFRAKPEFFIKSHMPFDPLWQFLYSPLTSQEFSNGKTITNTDIPFFDYADTLILFEKQTLIDRLLFSGLRIEKNGVKNSLIYDALQHNKREVEYLKDKLLVETYNESASYYNEGVNKLNKFIDYRNKQFSPQKPDVEIRKMVDDAENDLTKARKQLNDIKNPNSNYTTLIMQLLRSVDEALANLNEQKTFLEKYFSTGKMFRKSLFYKYSWMGLPLN